MNLKVTDNVHLFQRPLTITLLQSPESAPGGNNDKLHTVMSEFYIAEQTSITKHT